MRPVRVRAPCERLLVLVRVFIRGHPRFGVALLAVVVLTAIGLGGGAVGGSSSSRPAPAEPLPSASPLPSAPSLATGERRGPFPVLRVVDGETLVVDEQPGGPTTVRLLGIDAPLLVDQGLQANCLASAATQALKSRVTGREVSLEIDPSQSPISDRQLGNGSPGEKEARQVAYVYVGRTLVNQALLEGGFAIEYADHPYRLQAEFRGAEGVARQKGLGVWSPGRCATGGR